MKPRAWTTLLVMFVVVAVCAAAQEFSPPLGAARLKPPLLLGAAVYWGMRREPLWAGLAAAWCGALEDALGGVPCGTSPLLLAPLAVAASVFARPQIERGLPACLLAGAVAAPVLQLWQYLALRLAGGYAPLPPVALGSRLALSVPAGALAALAVGAAAAGLDWLSVNTGLEEDDREALDWD